jgi:hypothetical protein
MFEIRMTSLTKPPQITIDIATNTVRGQGIGAEWDYKRPSVFRILLDRLTYALCPIDTPKESPRSLDPFWLKVEGVSKGDYTLQIDGKEVLKTNAEKLSKGLPVAIGPDFDQVEKLRQTIIEKNRLYFHRWRPQNETYLFGFRKHEQGQNSREIPQFDPLIEKIEKEIAVLRVPVPHTYEIVPAK